MRFLRHVGRCWRAYVEGFGEGMGHQTPRQIWRDAIRKGGVG